MSWLGVGGNLDKDIDDYMDDKQNEREQELEMDDDYLDYLQQEAEYRKRKQYGYKMEDE